ncbi:protein that induces appearance of [PIN+] prion when overproduced [Ophidiomyces ophidiicola]|nr:protein that induces appearance of [PIN+] prion when overproduced [Ophidiomyces ophidiicola]
MTPSDASIAMTNRSLRTIKTELEFLCDSSVITPGQLSSILSQLPNQTQLHAPVSNSPANTSLVTPISTLNSNEKNGHDQTSYGVLAPPPSYASSPPLLCMASALYAYTPTDAGDLALQANDRIQVLEHMNNDWWRGRNERTNLEGIFPRTYVTIIDEKPAVLSPQPTNYGNMPLEVAGSSSQGGKKTSKFEENGKKFGKKMGNAAIFGAGATIGSNIVNGIF